MTGLPTWAEFTGLLVVIGTGIGAIWNRFLLVAELRGKIETLTADVERMKEEAAKALRTHEDAMSVKNEEIKLLRENNLRREDRLESKITAHENRIQELTDRLYMGGPR